MSDLGSLTTQLNLSFTRVKYNSKSHSPSTKRIAPRPVKAGTPLLTMIEATRKGLGKPRANRSMLARDEA